MNQKEFEPIHKDINKMLEPVGLRLSYVVDGTGIRDFMLADRDGDGIEIEDVLGPAMNDYYNTGDNTETLYLTAVNVTFVLKGRLSQDEVNGFVDYLNDQHNGGKDYFAAVLREYASQKVTVNSIM